MRSWSKISSLRKENCLPLSNQVEGGYLVLARHGNTFEPDQKVVWVGSRNDLSLSARGLEQAQELADACKENHITFDTIVSGPLRRTRDYAKIVKDSLSLGVTPQIDECLNEIDYGSWSGLSDQEVIERFGEHDFKAWNQKGIWPKSADWGDTPDKIISEIKDFCASLTPALTSGRNVLAVTSNGRLKYFLTLVEGAFETAQEKDTLKVKTGNICVFSFSPEIDCRVWNQTPKIGLASLASACQKK
jgi:broad specificity phosphatase PhoE